MHYTGDLLIFAGAFVMKLSKPLDKLPRRNTDMSFVVTEEKYMVYLFVEQVLGIPYSWMMFPNRSSSVCVEEK
jgi:hypothetical protein